MTMSQRFAIQFLAIILLAPLNYGTAGSSGTDSLATFGDLFIYDRSLPLEMLDSLIFSDSLYTISHLSYLSPRGGRVTGYLVRPTLGKKHAGILFGHWGYGTSTEFLAEAILYARDSAVSLLIDYPWVRPDPWRRNLANFSDPEYDQQLYAQAVVDMRRGIDLLLSIPGLDSNRIAYIGHSYGAQWGAIIAAVDRRLAACILIGGTPTLAEVIMKSDDPDFVELRRAIPKNQIDSYLKINAAFDAIHYIPYAAPTPLFFQFARFERYFSIEAMEKYFAAASVPKEIRWYNTGHEINDLQALCDRREWLKVRIGLGSTLSPHDAEQGSQSIQGKNP